jgi:uncharacterized membrane protein
MWMIAGYIAIVFLFIGLDAFNFMVLAKDLYASLYKDGFTNYKAALAVYVLYPMVVFYLTSVQSSSSTDALQKAAVLGFAVYGIYHLTNMATFPAWNLVVAAYDTLWGMFVTTVIATAWFLVV